MGQKITLGGQRLGAGGNPIKQELHNYERSTHDLSESIVTSMSCGTLTPFMVKPVLRGDVFEIKTDAACRTVPTKGPLFGSYKLQGDYFFIPVRLYQALLHNNPMDISLNMDKVMLPSITIETTRGANEDKTLYGKFNLSSLMKYCGVSGIGRARDENQTYMARQFQAVPMLGYYDIYKNFYANKQEENGKVIGIVNQPDEQINTNINFSSQVYDQEIEVVWNGQFVTARGINFEETASETQFEVTMLISSGAGNSNTWNVKKTPIFCIFTGDNQEEPPTMYAYLEDIQRKSSGTIQVTYMPNGNALIIAEPWAQLDGKRLSWLGAPSTYETGGNTTGLEILDFPLKNLDDMRYELLTHHELGVPFKLGRDGSNNWTNASGQSEDGLPYSTLFAIDHEGRTANKYPMNGLCLKTYQNDIYNTWLNSEIIDGEGGVNDLTKVQVQDGAFMINALLYAEKLYELYNRIAATDGTYDSWLNVVYEQEDRISHEKPLYLGGFYNEIVFEEIVQSAPAGGDPLGELGGKGTLAENTKGGKVVFKASEIGFIIGIISITPRIYYTQQNEFYMTDIKSMDDFHKPALDQIGFQDLVGERLNFEDTIVDNGNIIHRSKIGKLPAWLEYQTSVDKAYGDLAEPNGNGYMILNRNYETDDNGIIDATTYIDPTKYNYAFAYSALDSQNFWVQTRSKIIARRKMSANLLPNI